MIRLFLFTAALCGTVVVLTEWTVVERNVNIPWDLEKQPLQIKTNSTEGAKESMMVTMKYKNTILIGAVSVFLDYTTRYSIDQCTDSFQDLPIQPPVEMEKIWNITKTETALIIKCNDVELVSLLFAESSQTNCVATWGGNIVDMIFFSDGDEASDFYKGPVECPSFTVEGSTQGNWSASPTGTTVTIECATTHYVLAGSATLTCQDDGSWSSDVPQCDEIGKTYSSYKH
eukprot:sb/3469457/